MGIRRWKASISSGRQLVILDGEIVVGLYLKPSRRKLGLRMDTQVSILWTPRLRLCVMRCQGMFPVDTSQPSIVLKNLLSALQLFLGGNFEVPLSFIQRRRHNTPGKLGVQYRRAPTACVQMVHLGKRAVSHTLKIFVYT